MNITREEAAEFVRLKKLADAVLSPARAIGSPALPMGMTRTECMDGLRATRDMAATAEKRSNPGFVCWPDLDALLDWIDANGFPAPENNA